MKNYASLDDSKNPKKKIRAYARSLGANWIVTASMQMKEEKFKTNIEIFDVDGKRFGNVEIKAKESFDALNSVGALVIGLLKDVGAIDLKVPDPVTVSPKTKKLGALLTYANCYQVLVQQSIGIRQPVMLNDSLVDEAIELCEESKRLDGSFEATRAALGLAYALKGRKRQAELYLGSVKNSKAMLPLYWIGKFWVLSRYYNVDQALEVLEDAIDIYPGFLLARGYLGESLNTMRRSDAALKIFEAYLDQVPNQPWVMGQLGYTYSKLRKSDAAIQWTKKGLRTNPDDGVLMLMLASRMVDTNRLEDSVSILRRIINEGNRRGEVYLRLGYSLLLLDRHSEAERYFRTALMKSSTASEWRTRGRARYDLAKLWMRLDNPDNAIRQLRMAVKEGFRNLRYFELDPDFAPLQKDRRFKKLIKNVKIGAKKDFRFLSPFLVNNNTGHFTKKPFKTKTRKKVRF
jgi:tetratricopeptide (TPR) repeat protein